MYIVLDYIELGPIGTTKFWKKINKKNKMPKENRVLPTADVKNYLSQLLAGLYHSKYKLIQI
jgi:hypothetical protein